MFDSNLINWVAFWKRFNGVIHSKKEVNEAKKLTYLTLALNDGPAQNLSVGLSQTTKNYEEAIKCVIDLD